MKLWKKQVEEVVATLSAAYGFDSVAALTLLNGNEEKRGRPEKKVRVVNKGQMVTDVIATLLSEEEKPLNTVVPEVTTEVTTEVTPVKKKAAPKKKEKTPEPVVVLAPVVEEELAVEELDQEEEEGESTSVKAWIHQGTEYYKDCDCDEEGECDCHGVVYDQETQDPVGTWDGVTLKPLPAEDDE